jgi:hypothetical protein
MFTLMWSEESEGLWSESGEGHIRGFGKTLVSLRSHPGLWFRDIGLWWYSLIMSCLPLFSRAALCYDLNSLLAVLEHVATDHVLINI